MKTRLFFLSCLLSLSALAQDCSDLFISEYVEGWSNNKALEIYNPTANAIDLSQYMIVRYSNGATSASASNAVQLSGTVAAYDVYVAVIDKRDPNGTGQEAPVWDSLEARGDGFYSPDYNASNAMYFNGNDAVVLAKGTINDIENAQLIDVFGKIGEDPGTAWTSEFPYTGAGEEVTKDHSMIRKANVLKGETNPTISQFNPLGEYDSIPPVVDIDGQLYGNWFSLGSHECECNPLSVKKISTTSVAVFPNPSNGTFHIRGLKDAAKITVVNALGQNIPVAVQVNGAILTIDLSANKGVYFIQMEASNGTQTTQRVIVK